jgi:hypothetical protein
MRRRRSVCQPGNGISTNNELRERSTDNARRISDGSGFPELLLPAIRMASDHPYSGGRGSGVVIREANAALPTENSTFENQTARFAFCSFL